MNRFFKLLFVALISSYMFSQTSTSFFKFASLTGSNHIIGLPKTLNPNINGTMLASGDEIGVFTSEGLCVGAVVWKGEATSIVAWADNAQTSVVDGFREKTIMYFRIYSQKAKKQYYASAQFTQSSNIFENNGFSLLSSLNATNAVSVENNSNPNDFKLSQNYPNPFNPTTKINFSLPAASKVTLTIFDLNGKEITKIINEQNYSQGSHSSVWNGKDFNGNNVSSGLYFYRLDAFDASAGKIAFTQVKSMLLMK